MRLWDLNMELAKRWTGFFAETLDWNVELWDSNTELPVE